jgi:hypothetical protein
MQADADKFDDTNSRANKEMRSNADAVQVVTTLFNSNSSVAPQPAEAVQPRRSKCINARAMNSLTLLMKNQTLSSDEEAVEAAVAAAKGHGADYVAGVDLPGGAPYAIDPNAPACNEEQEAALQKMLRWLRLAHQAKQPGATQSFLEPAPLWLLHGPGGCGKSFWANKLVEAARAHTKQRGCVRGCAPTGVSSKTLLVPFSSAQPNCFTSVSLCFTHTDHRHCCCQSGPGRHDLPPNVQD